MVGSRGFSSCPGLLTGSPLQRTMEHLWPEDRPSSSPFQHMPSLHSSSIRHWHFCLAISSPGSHKGVVLFIFGVYRNSHAGKTVLADATTHASMVLCAPSAHCRVGEMAWFVPVGPLYSTILTPAPKGNQLHGYEEGLQP